MKLRLLFVPAILALGIGLTGCDDDDNGDNLDSEVEGVQETAEGQIDDASEDLADELEEAAGNVEEGSDEGADNLLDRCGEIADAVPDDMSDEATDLCEQAADALRNLDGDNLRRIADELRELVE